MKKITFLFAFLCASVMGWATDYCHTEMSAGGKTIYLTCQEVSAGNYQLKVECDEAMSGLGGSFCEVNGVGGYQLNAAGHFTLAADGKTITCDIASSTKPNMYTPLYVLIDGEKNFGSISDASWASCGGGTPEPTGGEKFVAANASIAETFFANGDWSSDANSSATYNSSTGVINVSLSSAKWIQWQAQVKLNVGFAYSAEKYYDFSITFHANKEVPQVTLKTSNNNALFYEDQSVTIPEDDDYVFTISDVAGKAGDNLFVFDFGHAAAGTEIEISDISIIEKDAPSTPVVVPDPNDHTAGGHTVHLEAYYVNDIYTLNITSTDDMQGLGGSFWNVNGVGTDMRSNAGTNSYTVSGDKKTITCQVQSSSAPNIYTPLYVLMPGEVNFGNVTLNWEDRTPIASEYCNALMSSGNTQAAFTWETDANGDVNITISETLGGSADAAHFRGHGITAGKIKVGEGREDVTTYFTHPGDIAGQQTLTLTLTDPANAPAKGTKIYVESQVIEYTTSKDGNAWPTLTFVYSYGGICNQLDAPTNVAVSTDSVITFDAVAGATNYTAYVYLAGVEKYSQEVTNGGVLHFWPYEDGAYTVNVIASAEGKMDSDPSADCVWNLDARAVVLGNSEYCEHIKQTGTDTEAAFTWETDANGNIVITISETLGGAANASHFRGNALALANFKVGAGQAAGSNYFSHPGTTTGNQLVLTATTAPALGEKIYYHGTVEYATSKDGNAWPTLDFEWTYGTVCSGKAVSATPNDNTMGTAVVKKGDDVVTSVEDGDEVQFIATVADAEQYRFVNWTKAGVVVSTNATYVTTITETTNLIANFDYIRNVYCHSEINSVQNKKLYLTLGSIGGGQYQIKIEGSAEAKLTGLNNANYTINWVTTDIEDGDKKMSGQDVPFNNARWAFDASGYGSATATFGIAEGHTWEDIYVWNHAIYFSTAEGEVGYTGFPGRHNIDWTATCADEIDPVLSKAEGEVLSETSVRLKVQATDNWEGILTYTISRAGAENIVLHGASGEELTQDVTGLTTGTEYTFTVLVQDAAGNNDVTPIVITPVGDEEKPVMGVASLESNTWNSAIINVAATDNKGVTAYYIVELDAEFVPTEGKITVEGLTQATAYTFNIKAKDAAGNISDNATEVSFTTDAHLFAPTTAPAAPTLPAAQVISFYSDTYTAPTTWNYRAGWGGSTAYEQVAIAETNMIHYSNLDYVGWVITAGNPYNALTMEKLHLDIWVENDCVIGIVPIYGGSGLDTDDNKRVKPTLHGQQWNSIDLDLATDYAGLNLSSIFQFKFDQATTNEFYLDNVYFYRESALEDSEAPENVYGSMASQSYYSVTLTLTATDDNGAVNYVIKNGDTQVASTAGASGSNVNVKVENLTPGTEYAFNVIAKDGSDNTADAIIVNASTLAAPASAPVPTYPEGMVMSLYSDAYAPVVNVANYCEWWWESPTVHTNHTLAEGDHVLFYDNNHQAGASFGWSWSGDNKINFSNYQKLHLSVYPSTDGTIEIYPVVQPEAQFHKVSQNLVGGQWNDIVLDYTDKTFAPLNQIGFINFYDLGEFFVDNVYFFAEAEDFAFEDDADNATIVAANDKKWVNATIKRNLLANGEWFTLCLPFDMTDAQLTDAFGAGYILAAMTGAEDRGSLIHLNFENVYALEAGKPYLLRPTEDFHSGDVIETVMIKNVDPAAVKSANDYMEFQGTFKSIELNQENQRFVGPENYLYSPAEGGTNMKSFRCYFTIPNNAPSNVMSKPARVVFGPQSATDIEMTNDQSPMTNKIIRDGQLLIIRDGRTYNAQGMSVK